MSFVQQWLEMASTASLARGCCRSCGATTLWQLQNFAGNGACEHDGAQASKRLLDQRLPGPKPYYVTGESPQLWFEPSEVWEIRGAELTLSPVHKVPPAFVFMNCRQVCVWLTASHWPPDHLLLGPSPCYATVC